MAKIRSLLAIAAGAALVGGCAVAPYDNGYGYGYGNPYGNAYDYPGYAPGYAQQVSPYDDDPFYGPGYYGPSVGLGFSFGGTVDGGHHHDGHDWHGHREGRGDGGHEWHGDGGGSRGGGTPDNGRGG